MATRTWLGTTSTTWTTGANWSGGSVPVNGDDIVFDETAVNAPDPIDQSSVDPASVTITEGFAYSLGTSASAIQLGTVTRFDMATGGSLVHLDATVTTAKVAIGQSQQLILGGTWTTLLASGLGKLDCDTAEVTTLVMHGPRAVFAAGTKPTTIIAPGGTVQSSRNLGDVTIGSGATLRTTGSATIDSVVYSGTVNHNSTGTVTEAIALPGGRYEPGKDHTITTLYETNGSVMNDQLPSVDVTITNRERISYSGTASAAAVGAGGITTGGFIT